MIEPQAQESGAPEIVGGSGETSHDAFPANDVGQDGRTRGASSAVLPSGRYRTIVVDPPWDYGRDHERWPSSPTRKHDQAIVHAAIPYAREGDDEIVALAVGAVAAPAARVFLWTTSRHLPIALRALDAWGFEYRQTIVWRKTGNPTPFGGSVAPNHAEFLLVAQRGVVPVLARLASSVVDAPAIVTGHSRKPECFLDYIEQVSPGPYAELFARRDRLGWDTWGNESLGTAEVAA